jgi:hypothetical protein
MSLFVLGFVRKSHLFSWQWGKHQAKEAVDRTDTSCCQQSHLPSHVIQQPGVISNQSIS